jgi:hypothetical protein
LSTLNEDGAVENEFSTDIAPDSGSKRRGRQPYPRDEMGNIVRPDGSKGKSVGRPRSKISLEAQLDGFVTLVNTFVLAFKPLYGLDQVEKSALVKALDQQCQTSPKFRKYIEKFLQGAGSANLFGVVIIILSRRVLRANLIPIPADAPIHAAELDNMAGALLFAMTTGTPTAVPTGV